MYIFLYTMYIYISMIFLFDPVCCRCCTEDPALSKASTCLRSKSYKELVDFDNHLDDISLDWTNLHINKLIDRST